MDCIGIAYYGYESPNYKEWLDYGPEVYGFGLNETRGDEGVYLTMDDRSEYRLSIHPGEVNRMSHVGLHMKNKFAWEDGIETLRRYGIEVTVADEEVEAKRGCSGVAQFKDPAGWPHELAYGLKYDTGRWLPGRAHAGFESPKYGLGHTVLYANDLEKIDDYAQKCMEYKWFIHGLRKGMASFYRTKLTNLSHVVAYGLNPNFQPGDTTTLPHIGIYCKTLDDVGIAYDAVQERRPDAIVMTLGRHVQDPVVSFYAQTPSGFIIEYIWCEDLEIPEETYVEGAADRLSVWGHKMLRPMH